MREFTVAALSAPDAVLIADIKKGTKNVGVARQYTSTAGACTSISAR